MTIEEVLNDLCYNTMGNPPYRIKEALAAIAKIRLEELPEEKEHKEFPFPKEYFNKARTLHGKDFNVGYRTGYNTALADARERIGGH